MITSFKDLIKKNLFSAKPFLDKKMLFRFFSVSIVIKSNLNEN